MSERPPRPPESPSRITRKPEPQRDPENYGYDRGRRPDGDGPAAQRPPQSPATEPYIVEGGGCGPQTLLVALIGAVVGCVLLLIIAFVALRGTVEDVLGIDNDDDKPQLILNDDDTAGDDPTTDTGQGGSAVATATSLPGIGATRAPGSVPSPTGDLLFVSNRTGQWEIWVMAADGSNPGQLTFNSPDINYSPGWSPDGTQIVFEARRNGNWDIYVMNADGSDIRRLTTNSAVDRVPVWSPDGSVIAFSSDRQGDFDIHLIQPDGSGLQQITFDSADDYYPAFSPNGQELVFQSGRTGVLELYRQRIDATDAAAVQLTYDGAVNKGAPNWSPDGQQIAYFTNAGQSIGQDIYIVAASGGTPRPLAASGNNEVVPTWSPDGRYVYFHEGIGGGTNIRRVDVQSGQVVSITSRTDRNWSPDLKPNPNANLNVSLPVAVQQPTTAPQAPVQPQASVFCPNTQPGFLNVGERAVGVDGSQPRLFAEASTASREIGDTIAGIMLQVLDGPRCSDGETWWYVQYGLTFGWIRETDGQNYILRSAEADIGGFTPPTNRAVTPNNASLLTGGFGFTDGSAMNPGEFQIEWYCNILGYGVSTDGSNWLCTVNGVTLAVLQVADLDRICQATYSNARAFAVQDGQGDQPAFRWRCYGG